MELPVSRRANVARYAGWVGRSPAIMVAGMLGIVLIGCRLGGCHSSSKSPLTLTFLDPEWSHDSRERNESHEELLLEFTQKTGIRVTHLPAPETAPAQLALAWDLLRKGSPTPDVYGIDVIWPGILDENLIDLNPYLAKEMSSEVPALVANYTVKGKLVAVPYHADIGALYYRTDLIEKYGYHGPPKSWDELEKMAVQIQEGERKNGSKDFWGFVWPGAPSEGLTCNALEWQASEGGGRIIEPDGRITVNNRNAVRAWERAAHWVGWISPPSVLSYQEWDAANAFWTSGRAAFLRGWTSDYFISHPVEYPFSSQSGLASLPGGRVERVATLGGLGLAVSRSSLHQREAVELVQFLLQKEAELDAERGRSEPPKRPELHDLPAILKAYAKVGNPAGNGGSGIVTRPSSEAGQKYSDVTAAYIRTVHSVLAGKAQAQTAAAALEKELAEIISAESRQP
jgi:trehalose/maltose transport system substrate-binding protein